MLLARHDTKRKYVSVYMKTYNKWISEGHRMYGYKSVTEL